MAAGDIDLQQILRSPGRLCVNPTNLATAWPHGGTGIGAVGTQQFSPNPMYGVIPDEAKQNVTDVVFIGFRPIFRALLRQPYDLSVIQRFWPNSTIGSVSGRRVITIPHASLPPGTLMSTVAAAFLFTPYDQLRDYGIYFPKGIPLVARELELEYSLAAELALRVEIVPIDDASGRNVVWGPLVDMTL